MGTTYRTKVHFTSQEVRLQSDTKGFADWILGAYYYSESLNQWYGAVLNPLGFGGLGSPLTQKTRSYAAFGNVVFRLNEQWNIRGGVRLTRDKRRGTSSSFLFDGTGLDFRSVDKAEALGKQVFQLVPDITLQKHWTKPSGEVTLSYTPSETTHLYAGYSVGFKGGDFNGGLFSAAETVIVDPEFVKNIEVGAKFRSPGGALSADLSLFRMRITDQQVSSITSVNGLPALVLGNAAASRLEGLELDLAWRIGAGLSVRGSLGLLDAKFRKYPNAPGGGDFSGNRLAYAPRMTANLALRYDAPTTVGEVTAEVSMRYVTKQYDQPSNDPLFLVRPYGYADAFLAFSPAAADRWNFRVWVKNLTNRKYYSTYFNGGGLGWNALGFADPRTFGVAVAYRIE